MSNSCKRDLRIYICIDPLWSYVNVCGGVPWSRWYRTTRRAAACRWWRRRARPPRRTCWCRTPRRPTPAATPARPPTPSWPRCACTCWTVYCISTYMFIYFNIERTKNLNKQYLKLFNFSISLSNVSYRVDLWPRRVKQSIVTKYVLFYINHTKSMGSRGLESVDDRLPLLTSLVRRGAAACSSCGTRGNKLFSFLRSCEKKKCGVDFHHWASNIQFIQNPESGKWSVLVLRFLTVYRRAAGGDADGVGGAVGQLALRAGAAGGRPPARAPAAGAARQLMPAPPRRELT